MDDSAFVVRLRDEIDRWEQEGLLDRTSLRALRLHYGLAGAGAGQADPVKWIRGVLYLAVIAFLAAFFSFAGSGTASLGPALRVAVLLGSGLAALVAGGLLYGRRRSEGTSLLILGGLLLPIAFFFGVHYYHLWLPSAPYLWWALLGGAMTVPYGLLGVRLQDEGLGAAAVLSALSVPYLLVTHGSPDPGWYPVLTAVLALCAVGIGPRLPLGWAAALMRPLQLLGLLLPATALVLPPVLSRYGTGWGVATYLLLALCYLLHVIVADSVLGLAPFTLAVLLLGGSFVRAMEVGVDALPLVHLLFSSVLIGAGVLALRRREQALSTLLGTLLLLSLAGLLGLGLLRSSAFRAPWLLWLSIVGYAVAGTALYALSWWLHGARSLLAYLGTCHLFAALVLALCGSVSAGTEAYGVPLGCLLLGNALFFVPAQGRNLALTLAVAVLCGPSLYLSLSDGGALRTVLLSLFGIGLIAAGAFRSDRHALLLGVLVLLPAVFVKILPGLAELGIPRFVWFGGFGLLLAGVALGLQRRAGRAALSSRNRTKSGV